MKILHLTNNYPTQNNPIFGIFVKEQIESLDSYLDKNEVFFINGREKGKTEYVKSIFRLRAFLRNNHFDLIHCHHALSALILILSGFKKRKFIVSFQNDPTKELGQFIFNFIKRRASGIIFKNNSKLNAVNSNIHYLPNGVNLDFFRPLDKEKCKEMLGLKKDKKYVLFVSSNFIRKQKRYDKFVSVLDLLKSKYHLADVEELKMTNIERNQIPLYFNASDLHLLTSDFEGSPNSVKEALSCNTKVVSTDVGNVRFMMEGIKGCFTAKENSIDELALLANRALNFDESNGRDRIIDLELDMASVAKKLVRIYKNLIKK